MHLHTACDLERHRLTDCAAGYAEAQRLPGAEHVGAVVGGVAVMVGMGVVGWGVCMWRGGGGGADMVSV